MRRGKARGVDLPRRATVPGDSDASHPSTVRRRLAPRVFVPARRHRRCPSCWRTGCSTATPSGGQRGCSPPSCWRCSRSAAARSSAAGAGMVVLLAAGGLVAALVEEPTPLAVVLAALAASMLAVLNRNAWPGGTRRGRCGWSRGSASRSSASSPTTASPSAGSAAGRRPAPARRGWSPLALPVVLGAVFVALFRAANPVIARLVGGALDWVGRHAVARPGAGGPAAQRVLGVRRGGGVRAAPRPSVSTRGGCRR